MKTSTIAFIFMMVVSVSVNVFRIHLMHEEHDQNLRILAQEESKEIELIIENALTPVRVLGEFVKITDAHFTKLSFDSIAKELFNSEELSSLAWLPDGIVKYNFPYEENKSSIGKSAFEENRVTYQDAIKARDTQSIVLSGPFEELNSGRGLLAINPIFLVAGTHWSELKRSGKFIGFTSLTMRIPEIFEASRLSLLDDLGYEYALFTTFDHVKKELISSKNFEMDKSISKNFFLYGQEWVLHIYSKTLLYEEYKNLLITFIINLLVLFVVYYALKNQESKKDIAMQQLNIDGLTGAYNKRFLEQYFKKHTILQTKLTLFFIDLNDFKPVNDTYGHDVGDQLLLAYTRRLIARFKKSTLVVRTGGDEFIVIIEEDLSQDALENILHRLYGCSNQPFVVDELSVQISSSIGFAWFPKEAETLEEISVLADSRMYAKKQALKRDRKVSALDDSQVTI